MDSAKILQWLKGQEQPIDRDLNDIRLLNEEYPYWPVAQWLFSRYVKKDEGRTASHYKTDPIQFARFFAPKASSTVVVADPQTATEVEMGEATNVSDVNEAPSVSVPSPPEEPVQEERIEPAVLDSLPEIPDVEEQDKISAESQHAEEETAQEGEKLQGNHQETLTTAEEPSAIRLNIQNSSDNEVTLAANQEDILALIHDLPNSIPASEELETLMPVVELTKDEPEVSSEDNEDDKSLMVMMSFTDWLHYFKNKRKQEQEEEDGKRALRTAWQKEKLTAAIEEETDAIPEPIFKQAMESISSDSGVISESLALVLAKQGKFDKAIEMYRKLSLRNPQKSTYFAGLIQELRLKQNG